MRLAVPILAASLVLSAPAWPQNPPAGPAVSDQDVSDAYICFYRPAGGVADGSYYSPPVRRKG